jgi:hypothetical protein
VDSDQGLQQACATMTAVREPLVELGLHAGNKNFNAQHQE